MKFYRFFPLIFQKLIWVPTRLILVFFGKLEIKGLENLKDIQRNVIFAMNHSSEIDPFIVPASLSFFSHFSPLFYPTREKKFYVRSGWRKWLFGGWFIKMWGGYTVGVGLNDYSKSLEQHIKIAKDGGNFCYFPEGRITPNGQVQEGKGGIGYMVHKTNITVVPVALKGAFGVSLKDFFLRRRKLVVYFDKPFTSSFSKEKTDVDQYKTFADSLMKRIGFLLQE